MRGVLAAVLLAVTAFLGSATCQADDTRPVDANPAAVATPSASPHHPALAHAVVRVDGSLSFLIGNADHANLFHPTNSAANVGWLLQYLNTWDNGLLTVSYQRLFTNDVHDRLLQTISASLNIHSVKVELDRYEIRREWDQCVPDCSNSIERIEAAVGVAYNHPGPLFTTQAAATAGSYHATFAVVDYFFGSPALFGFDGQNRRFDLLLGVSRGTHTSLTPNGSPDNGSRGLITWSPTYAFSLSRDGRTNGYLNYTNSSHVYDGLQEPLHTDDYEVGFVRQASRNLYVELHLNSLTKQGTTAPQYLPYSLDHANIDLLVRLWLNRPS